MPKIIFRGLAIFAAFLFLSLPSPSFALPPGDINDWYIKDFQSDITANKDSSLLIDEKITADCGNLPDKHGISRTVPTQISAGDRRINTPVRLVGITDFKGNPLQYSVITDRFNHTVTWKIGDPNKTVTGENYYRIIYSVKNAIRSSGQDLDEFYWNLSGNFWDMEIDKFSADVSFPSGVDKNSGRVSVYSGDSGSSDAGGTSYSWVGENTLNLSCESVLMPGQGVTVSVVFPIGIFKLYEPSFFEQYGDLFWFILPISSLILCYLLWEKYGKDPKVNKAVTPEFEIPEGLTPIEVGTLESSGDFKESFISAAIVDLAVKKYISIEEVDRKWYAGGKDFKLQKTRPEEDFLMLSLPEKTLAEKIFRERRDVFLSLLKDRFYKDIPQIKRAIASDLALRNLMTQTGSILRTAFIIVACVIFFIGLILFMMLGSIAIALSAILSVFIFVIFGFFMPKRTPKGAELHWRIGGLKMYMEKAEKYRQQFYEKENIFEKFLPYAMVFGMADLWTKKMEEIYGQDYFQNYHPVWYAGAIQGNFNADAFAQRVSVLSAGIAASTGTASGAGGSGVSGGGGGGGGGSGW